MADRETASWVALQQALAGGDMEVVRQALRGLDEADRRSWPSGSGPADPAVGARGAAEPRHGRSASGGRVVVIHGIMGARLDVVEPDGDSDRVWVNVGAFSTAGLPTWNWSTGCAPRPAEAGARRRTPPRVSPADG